MDDSGSYDSDKVVAGGIHATRYSHLRAASARLRRVGKREKNRAQLASMLEQALHQAQRLNRLIGDLLDMSRTRADKLDIELAPHDLIVVVSDRVEDQRRIHPNRQIAIHLTLSYDAAHIPVVMDADRIGQVLANYLSNAVKYSPDVSPVTITLAQEIDTDGRTWARVAVHDGGSGIPAEAPEKVWERFYWVPGTQSQSGLDVGLGLGLYISRQIVELHGGYVGVESIEGKGATFWFALPSCATHEEDIHERQLTGR